MNLPKEKYALWLDDERDPREPYIQEHFGAMGDEVWVTSYQEFVATIRERGLPASVSFDHDLGAGRDGRPLPGGMECAHWLVEYLMNTNQTLPEFYVHSANPVGAENIRSLLVGFARARPELA